VTRLDTFARVIRHFGEFGASGHCLQNILFFALYIKKEEKKLLLQTFFKYLPCNFFHVLI
jgi:hypothetical protein